MSPNDSKLKDVLVEILLIDDDQYQDDFGPDEIETWDSLATVNIAAAAENAFGVAFSPEQMAELECIGDVKEVLRAGGIEF